MKAVALIPARGGSKRIPRKNVRPFLGKPVICYSIEAALDSGLFARVFVSTDDDEIAAVAIEAGAEVPFMRPAELADDMATTAAVMKHFVSELDGLEAGVDAVCCIYATAPLIRVDDLRRSFARFETGTWQYVFTATDFDYPIQRAFRQLPNGAVEWFNPEHASSRSQDLEPAYHDAGQFYWGRASAWSGELPAIGSESLAFMIPRARVQDIDTPEDWELAEAAFLEMVQD